MKPVVAGLYVDGGPRQLLDLQPAGEVSRRERCHEGAARVLGSIPVDRLTEEDMLTKTCGIDWSEGQHDVAIVDDQARVVARARVADDAAGFGQLLELLAEHHDGEQAPIEIAIETDKGLFVTALVGAGFTLFPINPRAAARYRERHGQAGGKSDRGDAVMLANILRTDRHAHRPLPADTELARAVKATARQHQEAIWARQQAMNRLRSLLRDYYPQALVAFPNLAHRAAASVLRAAPTPQAAARLTPRRVVTLLKQAGRRNDAGLAEKISSTLRAAALRQSAPVEHAQGVAALGLIETITAMSDAIAALKAELATLFDQHAQAPIITTFPGLGPVLGARVLGELGDDPHRLTDARGVRSFAGTAPITRASGRSRVVSARRICNRRLGDACHWWAYATLTKSAGARAHYDRRKAAGDTHNAALRNLANKLLSKLWHCLQTNTPYHETSAWPTPETAAA
jgi:transposase/transposase IS116/IS110/IS902 family protein